MQVTYIYHSSFLIELEQHLLLFDYSEGVLPYLDPNKKLFVFVSHGHLDHYNENIFRIDHPNISYVLSSDLAMDSKNVYSMKPHENLQIEDLYVSTLASTDQGVAFVVKVEEKQIYHAGDLHWWDWGSEDSEIEKKDMEVKYKEEIKRLKDIVLDVAFVVVDPRLQERFAKGMLTFIKECSASFIFPMHMQEEYDVIDHLLDLKEFKNRQNRIVRITHRNQIFPL